MHTKGSNTRNFSSILTTHLKIFSDQEYIFTNLSIGSNAPSYSILLIIIKFNSSIGISSCGVLGFIKRLSSIFGLSECSSAYPTHPHLLKIAKINYNRKLKKLLFDLGNTFVSNIHLFILLKKIWHSKLFNYNAIIKSF